MENHRIFCFMMGVSFSKQLKLDIFCGRFLDFLFCEKFHCPELFVCYCQYTDLSERRQETFYSFYMDGGIFCTWAVSHVD